MTIDEALNYWIQFKNEIPEVYKGHENDEVYMKDMKEQEDATNIIINALNIMSIVSNNIDHTQLEVIDGFPDGNVLLGMTCDDYDQIVELLN